MDVKGTFKNVKKRRQKQKRNYKEPNEINVRQIEENGIGRILQKYLDENGL